MTYSSYERGSLLRAVREDIATNPWEDNPELSLIEQLESWSTEFDLESFRNDRNADPGEYHGHRVIQRYISVLKLAQS